MKRTLCFVTLICLLLVLCACNQRSTLPDEGVFYCQELKMSIDFSLLNVDPECVKIYGDNGDHTVGRCMIDYGTGVTICSADQETDYICGEWSYEDGTFKITAYENGQTYLFERKDQLHANSNAYNRKRTQEWKKELPDLRPSLFRAFL